MLCIRSEDKRVSRISSGVGPHPVAPVLVCSLRVKPTAKRLFVFLVCPACERAERDCKRRERDPRQQTSGQLGARLDSSARDRRRGENAETRGVWDKAAMRPGCGYHSKTLAGEAVLWVAAHRGGPGSQQWQGSDNKRPFHACGQEGESCSITQFPPTRTPSLSTCGDSYGLCSLFTSWTSVRLRFTQ